MAIKSKPPCRGHAVWLNEAASLRRMVASARRYRDVAGLQLRDEAAALEKARSWIEHAAWWRTEAPRLRSVFEEA